MPTKSVLILAFLLVISSAIIIYPPISTSQIQWQQEEAWLNCKTNQSISAINCQKDQWSECYLIPNEGLCFNQKDLFTNQSEVTYKILAKFQTNSEAKVNIQLNSNNAQEYTFTNQNNQMIQDFLPGKAFSLTISTNSENTYLSYFQIFTSDECLPNCVTLSSDNQFLCEECKDNYFLYNYNCISLAALEQISLISQSSATQTIEIQSSEVVVTTKFKNFVLGDYVIPRVYLTTTLEGDEILTYLRSNMTKLVGSDTVQIRLPGNQASRNFETEDAYIFEYYLNYVLTVMGQVQYQLSSMIRTQVNKEVSSSVEIKQLSYNNPSTCCSKAEIEVVSRVEILNKTINGTLNQFTVKQIIQDPEYVNYQIQFVGATITWNYQTNNLDLISINQQDDYAILVLQEQSVNNRNNDEIITIEVKSQIFKSVALFRMLSGMNIKFSYKLINQITWSDNVAQTNDQQTEPSQNSETQKQQNFQSSSSQTHSLQSGQSKSQQQQQDQNIESNQKKQYDQIKQSDQIKLEEKSHNSNLNLILGLTFGSLLILILICVAVYKIKQKYSKNQENYTVTPKNEIDEKQVNQK